MSEDYTIKELAEKTGKSEQSIYALARKLNRKPTLEEVESVKKGRPKKYVQSKRRNGAMTLEVLLRKIADLIKLRKETPHTDDEELNRINTKLDKLYDLKYTYFEQNQAKARV